MWDAQDQQWTPGRRAQIPGGLFGWLLAGYVVCLLAAMWLSRRETP